MEKLFNRAAVFADLHLGKKNNSRQFNQDCEDFIHWFIEQAKEEDVDTVIFCGDWHDNRRYLNISTLNYSLNCMEAIDREFNWYFLPGNHDLPYREKRDMSSIEIARNLKNCHLIRDPETIGNVTFMPWLVDDEWKQIKNIKSKYIFGHFELPTFLMNQMVEMPDQGMLHVDDFSGVDKVFTGHFHKRQHKKNIHYIGSPFPHNYADAWDDERGMMILEWDGETKFKKWPHAPKYRTLRLSELLENPTDYIDEKTYSRIYTDIDLNYEEAQFLKELYTNQFQARDVSLIPISKTDEENEFEEGIEFQSIDQIVLEGLNSVESSTIENTKLVEIYNSL